MANTPPVPKKGWPGTVTGVSGSKFHLARPTTMSTKNGARMMIENSVELSAMTLTPMMFMSAKTAMIAQQMT
jgi:hypothetical protein